MGDATIHKAGESNTMAGMAPKDQVALLATKEARTALTELAWQPEHRRAVITPAGHPAPELDKEKELVVTEPYVQDAGAALGVLRTTLPWTRETKTINGAFFNFDDAMRRMPNPVADDLFKPGGALEKAPPLERAATVPQISEAAQRLLDAQPVNARTFGRGDFVAAAADTKSFNAIESLRAPLQPRFLNNAESILNSETRIVRTGDVHNIAAIVGAVGINQYMDSTTPRQPTTLSEVADFLTPIAAMSCRLSGLGRWAPVARAAIIVGQHSGFHYLVDDKIQPPAPPKNANPSAHRQ